MNLFNSLRPTADRNETATTARDSADLGPVVRPDYEIKEADDAYGLVVRLPGVDKGGLELTAEDTVLRIVGRRTWKQPEGWTTLYRESTDAAYELVLTHDHAVDLDKIHAELRDGLLRVSLPKAEAIKPRKIAIS